MDLDRAFPLLVERPWIALLAGLGLPAAAGRVAVADGAVPRRAR